MSKLVELSGNRPPSPKRRTSAFSRLSFEFVLSRRASRSPNIAGGSSLFSNGSQSGLTVPAELYDGRRGGFGNPSWTVTNLVSAASA